MKLYEIIGATPGKTILQVNNRKLVDTNHAYSRYETRFADLSTKKEALSVLKDAMRQMIDREDIYGDAYILVFSKKLNQGFIVVFNKDRIKSLDDGKRHFFLVTVLPQGKQHARSDTKKLIIESFVEKRYSSKFLNYINDIINIEDLNENTSTSEIFIYKANNDLSLFFVDNKLYDTSCIVLEC